MAVDNLFLFALLVLSTPQLSLSLADNRSDQDDFVKGDCSIQSCKHGQVTAAFANNSSALVTFVARSEYDESKASFVLKFENDYENSAMKQVTPPFDVKLLRIGNGANQKRRSTIS